MLPPSLAELQLFGNSIGDAGAAAIAGVAPSSLKKITFERNKIQRPADIQELLAGRGIRVELPRQDWPSDNPPVPPPFPLPSADLPPRKLALSMPLIAAGATPAVDPHRSLEELAACDKLAGDLELWTQYTAFIEGASSMANVMDKPVSTVGVEILGHVLQHPTHALTRLAFVRCALHFDDIVRLAALLPVGLTTLALDGNALQDEGVSALSPRLPSTRLETLSLPANDIGDAGMEVLALHLPPTLKELRLWGNRIGDAGVRALAHRIPPALKELDLSDNAIGDFGVLAFLSYLPATLTQLHLSENQVGAIGAAAIAEWIPSTTALRRLDLIGNRIGQVGMAALGAAHRPPTLRYLELVEDDD
ncbi:hypothetical protein BC828DRAFT_408786 [Blastocladiella britannica]|nr:hypothetical protein BC828DRAFT_408786 [Blastocladiella britannica]